MCGFVGIYSRIKKQVDKELIHKMNQTIKHRGPDSADIKMFPTAGLGHRRLSIIDIEGGQQPMPDHQGKAWIAFNGEIYNFKKLRKNLESKNISFRTNSDSEVLVNHLTHYGKEGIHLLNGIFSFAYYRPEDNYCLIARDHLGVKPLYYWVNGESIAFASEIKALLEIPEVKFGVDESLLEEFFTFRYLAGGKTLFKGIEQIEAGQYLEIKEGTITKKKYWDLPCNNDNDMLSISFDEATEELNDRISKAVELQLVADVPVGSFLSGGVDSGIITAISSKQKKDQLNTFSVGFDQAEWDERVYANRTSTRYNTRHHEYVMKPEAVLENIKEATYFNDEPLSHPNTIPLLHLSGLAKENVKVVLTGEGADEMLSGYPRHQIARARNSLKHSDLARKLIGTGLRALPHRKANLMSKGLLYPDANDMLIFNSQYIDNSFVNDILHKDIPKEGMSFRRNYADYFTHKNLHQQLMAYDMKTYLLSSLQRLDRVSMAYGLEARVPLLDYTLVEWILKLPTNYKVKGKTGKRILKKVAEKYMDKDIIYLPKSGFGLPLAEWFRDNNALGWFLDDILSGNTTINDYIDVKKINTHIIEHKKGYKDHSEMFWILLSFDTWCNRY